MSARWLSYVTDVWFFNNIRKTIEICLLRCEIGFMSSGTPSRYCISGLVSPYVSVTVKLSLGIFNSQRFYYAFLFNITQTSVIVTK